MSNFAKTEFWVCNITDQNVSLGDLRVTIPPRKGVNLLDSNHFSFTYEQLKQSAESGSIFRKQNKIKIGAGPPQENSEPEKTLSKFPIMRRKRTAVKIKEEVFEDDLFFTDEQYAEQMANEFDFDE